MGNRIGGDGVDYSVADSRSWLGAADAVPPDAWVLTVYLIGCKELVYGMSGDLGGRADPYLNLRLSKTSAGAEAFGGQQAQRSSRKSSTLDPRWMPPEPFTFIIPADMIPASAGGTSSSTVFPALVLQVMDWDLFSSHDEMGHCALSLADLIIGNPVDASQQKKKPPRDVIPNSAMDEMQPGRQLDAVDGTVRRPTRGVRCDQSGNVGDDARVEDNENALLADINDVGMMGPLKMLPLQHPKTNEIMRRTALLLRTTFTPRAEAFRYTEDCILEFMRWHPGTGWSSRIRSPRDPCRFALVVPRTTDPTAFSAQPQNTSSSSSSSSSSSASSSSVMGFSSDNFDSVAALIRHDDDIDDNDTNVEDDGSGGRSRVVILQWSVMTQFGDAGGGYVQASAQLIFAICECASPNPRSRCYLMMCSLRLKCRWQYNTSFKDGNTSWSPRSSKFSFVRRRFWRRRILHRTESRNGDGGKTSSTAEAGTSGQQRGPQLPLKAGWLLKRGEVNTALKARFFVLWPTALIYYKEEPPSYNVAEFDPQGVIPLKGAEVHWPTEEATSPQGGTPAPPSMARTFMIDVPTTKRSYVLKMEKDAATVEDTSVDEAAEWFHVIELTIAKKYAEAASASAQTRSQVDSRMTAAKAPSV